MSSVTHIGSAVQWLHSRLTSNLFTFTIVFIFTRNWLERKHGIFRLSFIFTSLCTLPLALSIQAIIVLAGLADWAIKQTLGVIQITKGAEVKLVIVLKSKHVLLMLMLYLMFAVLLGAK